MRRGGYESTAGGDHHRWERSRTSSNAGTFRGLYAMLVMVERQGVEAKRSATRAVTRMGLARGPHGPDPLDPDTVLPRSCTRPGGRGPAPGHTPCPAQS